jgi:hypothetical protein
MCTAVGLSCIGTSIVLYSQSGRRSDLPMPQAAAFRILLGIEDVEPTPWAGRVSLTSGTVLSIQGWRFAEDDASDYTSSWIASTRYSPLPAGARRQGITRGPVLENGVVISAADVRPETQFDIDTRQGNFTFAARDIPYGVTKKFLDGKVAVDRVPPTVQLTTSDEEQDFPAVAQSDDDVLLAYEDFKHGDRAQNVPGFNEPPKSFEFLRRPVGGDHSPTYG